MFFMSLSERAYWNFFSDMSILISEMVHSYFRYPRSTVIPPILPEPQWHLRDVANLGGKNPSYELWGLLSQWSIKCRVSVNADCCED